MQLIYVARAARVLGTQFRGGLSRARGPGEDVGMGCRAWRSREGSEARKKAVWGGWRKVTKDSFFVKKFGINLELDPSLWEPQLT